eukprot:ANDGO_08432.mRNA.1 Calcium-transporting ATPase sarcoplasmic/endoplasmic reticulum type
MNWDVPAYRLPASSVLSILKVNAETGLTSAEFAARRRTYGPNALQAKEPESLLAKIIEQFEDKLVRILLAAAVVSFLLALTESDPEERNSAFVEPLVILAILIANAVVGIWQESSADAAIEALKEYAASHATVIRDSGVRSTVLASELVPGDILVLRVGDKVPADCRLVSLSSTTLRAEQSAMTGESDAVLKFPDAIVASGKDSGSLELQSQTNMLFSGTTIVYGSGIAVVVATGMNCELGKIQQDVEDVGANKTPLQEKLDEFGEDLAKYIMYICIAVWVLNVNHFWDPSHGGVLRGAVYYFKIAVALAVAAIPEGLPAVVTTCLALATRKMAKKNAIVRSLPSVETLGCTTVICSDKTGTLTTNRMSAVKVLYALPTLTQELQEVDVSDTQYNPTIGHLPSASIAAAAPVFRWIARIAALCNESSVRYSEKSAAFERVGEPTEAALRVLVEKIGLLEGSGQGIEARSSTSNPLAASSVLSQLYATTTTLEFTRERKSMSVIVTPQSSGKRTPYQLLLVKGAPEAILERSSHVLRSDGSVVDLSATGRLRLQSEMDRFGSEGETPLRCLALAYREIVSVGPGAPTRDELADPAKFAGVESGLTFVGMVGLLDPPREEVFSAIARCHTAGIRVVMITGDNKVTAEAIAKRIGLAANVASAPSSSSSSLSSSASPNFDPSNPFAGRSFTGREFGAMSLAEKNVACQNAVVFSRVIPSHKMEIVRMLQERSQVVAMTGDGVNDSSALKAADIGIAMGSGTEVAKGACDMILADDNFSTIVSAVEEGRAIYNNTKQFIRYLISSNIGEVVCIVLTALLGMPEALVPVQLLWVNLVTDGLPATALGFNPADAGIMQQQPRNRDDPLVTRWLFFRYMVIGVYVGVATIAGFAWWFLSYEHGPKMSWAELTTFHSCEATEHAFANGFDCSAFFDPRPATVALSVLVTIEMFNACNAVSEDQSIFRMPPWVNPWLILAISTSFVLHFGILYIPFFSGVFGVAALSFDEWIAVLAFSAPVVFIDEVLKAYSRSVILPRSLKKKQH